MTNCKKREHCGWYLLVSSTLAVNRSLSAVQHNSCLASLWMEGVRVSAIPVIPLYAVKHFVLEGHLSLQHLLRNPVELQTLVMLHNILRQEPELWHCVRYTESLDEDRTSKFGEEADRTSTQDDVM